MELDLALNSSSATHELDILNYYEPYSRHL